MLLIQDLMMDLTTGEHLGNTLNVLMKRDVHGCICTQCMKNFVHIY